MPNHDEEGRGAMSVKRRDVIALLGGAALATPFAARAQSLPEIDVLNSVSFDPIADRVDAFLEGLEDTRFVDGRNVDIKFSSAEGQTAMLPLLAARLVRRNPAAIVCLT